jgi:hypothetical protein
MDSLRIVLSRRQELTTEQSRDARAMAWAYAFDCFNRRREQEGGPGNRPEDPERRSDEIRAKASIP